MYLFYLALAVHAAACVVHVVLVGLHATPDLQHKQHATAGQGTWAKSQLYTRSQQVAHTTIATSKHTPRRSVACHHHASSQQASKRAAVFNLHNLTSQGYSWSSRPP